MNNIESIVLDYELMSSCKFTRVDDSIFSGFKFTFEMRNFHNEKSAKINYKILVSYKWGSSKLGSVDPVGIITGLTKSCEARIAVVEKQRIGARRAEEKSRIEAETLKIQQEQQKAEEQRKKEEESRKEEEKKN